MSEIKLKVMEAVQDDVNKGIVKIDSNFMKQIDVNPGDVVEIKGERITAAVIDRAYPGDIGLNIIRMDGDLRKNARTSIGELVTVKKAEVKPAKKISIAPVSKEVMVKASPELFKQGLLGKALLKGDIVSLGRSKRRTSFQGRDISNIFSMMESQFAGFGFGSLKFIVVDTNPKKEIVVITPDTEVEFNPRAVEIKDEEAISLGVNYEDIGGLSEEIKKVREMIELPLKHPEIFEKLGIEPPKGVLLHGPPGTGKTLLAKAVASETNSHFILINGPEVISKFYGESEANLRKKFEEAEQNAPSIIFFDEIDAIATKREETKGDVEKRVVAQLLGLMDGLKSRGKVIVIAATNMPNLVDMALRRPGRFDREIEIGVPDKAGREEILKIHTRNMPLEGTLYGENIKKIIPELIKEKNKQLENELNNKNLDINKLMSNLEILKNSIKEKQRELEKSKEELLELEKRKQKADENLLYKLLESIRGLNKKIKNLNEEIPLGEEELVKLEDKIKTFNNKLKQIKVDIKEISDVKDNLKKSRTILNNLVEEMIKFDEMKSKQVLNNLGTKIIETNLSELYQKLQKFNLIESIVAKAKREGIDQDQKEIAKVTHGFVGADLNALAKEAAMIVLRRILPDLKQKGVEEGQPIPSEILEKLQVTQKDFLESLKVVRPSAMREVLVETPDVSWDDIGGLEDIKEKLKEAVEWPLNKPEVFKKMGIRPPKGILLYGPPGTGKTLLAKAVAKESEANFILVNGPSLLSKWVGESEKALRHIFRKARQTSPTILFFDEIDALVPRRGSSNDGSKVNDKMVNQMLTEMDGLESLNDVVIIGATNRPDIVDPALLRQGRFDRIIMTYIPEEEGRKRIFNIYTEKMPIAKDVDIDKLANKSKGYVGADIEGICREAAMIALREDIKSKEIKMEHFLKALDVVKPSVDKEIEDAYKQLEDYFSSARAKQIKEVKESYFG
ncbi:MAG: CDC48 family AAA ATPase [Nanoarchaeota archaeon]|nr:CDC48 family AAA ATPase [Nanoarchaeota archaeon]MBU1631598.1 CDC48 family AAA ATPase [Nanoarchaeota archaeon]MBU1876024.1 CDC48 family AAA ATPase [Nanoarchaeota archaeon]